MFNTSYVGGELGYAEQFAFAHAGGSFSDLGNEDWIDEDFRGQQIYLHCAHLLVVLSQPFILSRGATGSRERCVSRVWLGSGLLAGEISF